MKKVILGLCLLMLLPLITAAEDRDPTPKLVFTEFEKITMQPGEQALKLDATNFYGGVTSAHAIIQAPDGTRTNIMLRLISGDENYGTWRGTFQAQMLGEHSLVTVTLGDGFELPHEYKIEDRSFWIVGEDQQIRYDVIYTSMTPFTAELGENVTLKLDARDSLGIDNVTATLNWHNASGQVLLHRIAGDKLYGTYEATFWPDQGGTLYNLTTITINTKTGSQDIAIENRQVYIKAKPKPYIPPTEQPIIPPTPEQELEMQLQNPLLPTKLAFALMAVLLVFLLISHKVIKMVMKW